jgi:hypothetical protein
MSLDMAKWNKWRKMAEKIEAATIAYQNRLWNLESYCGCYSCKFFDSETNACGNLGECQKLNEFNVKWEKGEIQCHNTK